MKTTALFTVTILATALAAPFALAQETPAATAPASTLPVVSRLVYLNQLPTPASLMKEAAAQGQTIDRIDRTSDSIVVTYKYADGHTDAVAYTTLSAASTEEEPVAIAEAPVATPTPPPTVVYREAPRTVIYRDVPVYYEPRYRYYYDDPFDHFWAPLALGVGIGWISGNHGGHHRGHVDYHARPVHRRH